MVVVVVNEIFLSVRHCVSTALSLSVCHKSVFHQNAWRRNELVSGMEATEELKSKKKQICSEVSENSPGNPCSQS